MLCQPDSGEMALEVVDQTVRSSAVDIICVDSVAALVPRAEIEGEMGAHQGEVMYLSHCSCCCLLLCSAVFALTWKAKHDGCCCTLDPTCSAQVHGIVT